MQVVLRGGGVVYAHGAWFSPFWVGFVSFGGVVSATQVWSRFRGVASILGQNFPVLGWDLCQMWAWLVWAWSPRFRAWFPFGGVVSITHRCGAVLGVRPHLWAWSPCLVGVSSMFWGVVSFWVAWAHFWAWSLCFGAWFPFFGA